MPDQDPYPLFELSPEEFQNLSVDLLLSQGPSLSIAPNTGSRWIDAVATRQTSAGVRTVAIEASHRTALHPDGLRHFLERVSKEGDKFDEFIFVTSSPILSIHHKILSESPVVRERDIKILGKEEVASLLDKNVHVAAKYFKSVGKRVRRRKAIQFLSVAVLAASVFGVGLNLLGLYRGSTNPNTVFLTRIRSVEESLTRLADLEESLKGLKIELQQKAEESIRIAKEYDDASKLKALTNEQLGQVRKAIAPNEQADVLLNYFWGFLLGVASSVLATIITDRWKQKQALSKPYL